MNNKYFRPEGELIFYIILIQIQKVILMQKITI